jgi:hypothetical protein
MTDDAITQRLAREIMSMDQHLMELVLQPVSVFQLVAALQLARRHPQFADQETVAVTVERFLTAAREYFADCPTVLDVIRRGDDPTEDR